MSNIIKNDDFVDVEIVDDDDRQYARFINNSRVNAFSARFIGSIGLFGILFYVLYGFVQVWIGLAGLELYFDTFLAVIIGILAMIFLRMTIHLTIGGFYYLTHAWNWDWYFAVLFLMPSLLFLIPGFLLSMIATFRRR